jgi:nitrogen fixation NifU-like protein
MLASELRDLYQEVILDHSRRPRNFRRPERANRSALGYNALCGDRITVHVEVEGDRLADVGFEGSGCAICTASASVMTDAVKGKSEKEAEALFRSFHTLVTGKDGAARDPEALGKLLIFAGVSEFPIRVKCATLPWHTLHAALENQEGTVSTE